MKTLYITLSLIFLSCTVSAQDNKDHKPSKLFVRVYNLQGEKIAKGKILSISDTSLQLKVKMKPVNIEANAIAFIKTKKSVGKNMLIGAATGAGLLAIVGAAKGDPNDWFWAIRQEKAPLWG